MIYNTSNRIEADRVRKRLESLIDSGKMVELKVKDFRSLNQNNYLHLLLGYVAVETGLSADYVKQVYYKAHLNSDIYEYKTVNNITGEECYFWKSSSDISTSDMSLSVERLRNFASDELELYLPEPNEEEFLKDVAIEIQRHKQYNHG